MANNTANVEITYIKSVEKIKKYQKDILKDLTSFQATCNMIERKMLKEKEDKHDKDN